MPTHFGDEFDLSTALTKGRGLVKSQVVHSDHFGRSAERNPIPAQKPRDLQVPWSREKTDEDQIGWFKHELIIRLLPDRNSISPAGLGLVQSLIGAID